jgi:predicted Zn-dependent peptidase
VFATLFGGGMSSRLFQEVREKRGLVYAIHSYVSCYTDAGLFGVYAGTGADEVAELVPLVCDELRKVLDDVTEEEVARARAQLKASVLMGLESTSGRCEQVARQLLVFGRPLPISEVVSRVEAVDVAAVRRVGHVLSAGKPTLASLGPLARMPSLETVEAQLRRG